MNTAKRKATEQRKRKYYTSIYKIYDKTFDLAHFLRKYKKAPTEFTDLNWDDIKKAFNSLNKTDYEKQHIDCSACGSDTCYGMARKIALGLNMPANCIFKSKEDAKAEHEENLQAREQLARMEKAHEADERMRVMLDSNPHINILFNSKLRIVDCNSAALRFMGVDTKEEFFSGFLECMTQSIPEYQSAGRKSLSLGDRLAVAIEEGFVKFDTELVLGGARRNLDVSLKKIPYEDSFAIVGYIYDMTEIKALEEAANNANKAKSSFLSTMSHEIRTPMNAIIGMTSIGKTTSDVGRKDYSFNRIEDASKHLLGVINDILDMSKIEAGKFDLSPDEFNFERMLQRVANVVNYKIVEKRQSFKIYVDRAIPEFLHGDDQRLAQVITNLVGNAVKFTPEKGSIRIGTYFMGEENGVCTLKITVTDTGIGVSKEQQARLFQSFQQAEGSTARKFGGTGLGLTISKSIVEMMNGKIWIDSELGKGSTFSFTVQVGRSETDETKMFGYGVDWSGVRILVADGDADIDAFLKKFTGMFNAHCDTAASGEEMLRSVRENKPYDIFFIGRNLIDANSVKLIKALRKRSAARKTTIAVFSEANSIHEDEDAERKAGADTFVNKPLFPSNIIDSINAILGLQQKQADYAAPEEEKEEEVTFEKYRILLAEDVEINREIVVTILEPTRIRIDCAENGVQAIEMFKAAPDKYDMIFMDIQMPEMDGLEATRQIRKLEFEKAKTVPIVAMTANVFKEDIEKCIAAGMDGHVGKPIDFDEVIKALKQYLK